MSQPDIKSLQSRVSDLLQAFQKMEQENVALKIERESWNAERTELIAQNELAREKVKAILTRLKKMEIE